MLNVECSEIGNLSAEARPSRATKPASAGEVASAEADRQSLALFYILRADPKFPPRIRSSPSCSHRIHDADRGAICPVAKHGTSQFLCGEFTYVHGVFDRAGSACASR